MSLVNLRNLSPWARRVLRALPPSAPRSVPTMMKSSSLSTSSPPSITLFQYAICPFCHKVKALLSYADLRHDIVEVNPLTKTELKPWSDYKKVPIARIDGEQVNGSDAIVGKLLDHPLVISSLERRWIKGGNKPTMTIDRFRSDSSATRWAQFASDDLAALMYPNICRTLGASYRAFGYVNDVEAFSALQKVVIRGAGSLAMYLAASKIKSKRGISDEREALRECLSLWEKEGLDGGKSDFAGGTDPNLGDISVYGTLHSVEGLEAHDEAIQSDAVKDWYGRMRSEMQVESDER